MKKIVIISLVLLLVMSASSFATKTRTLVMGDNNGIMVDDYNVFRFPGRTFNYPNIAVAELMCYEDYYYLDKGPSDVDYRDDFYNFGINWQFGDDNPWVLGTYISTLPPMMPMGYWGNILTDWDYYYEEEEWSNRRIDLIYGRQMGSNNFGFRFQYTRGGWKEDDVFIDDPDTTTYQEEEAFSYYLFGLGLTEGSTGQWDIALDFGFGTWTDKNNDGETITEPNGYYDFTLEGRYFMVRSPRITLVPHAGFQMGKRGVKDYDHSADPQDDIETLDYTEEQSLFGFDAGVGMHYTPAPNLLAVADFGVQYAKINVDGLYSDSVAHYYYRDSFEDKWNNITIPYLKIGLEADVFNWMDVRFGATTYWNIENYEYNWVDEADEEAYNYKDTWKWADNRTYLGFCFHWGRLSVDTYADPQLFLNGFDFISSSGTDQMNFQLSALYEMF